MALNDIKVPKENAQGTFDETVLTPNQIGAASSNHAAAHASSGSDPVTPASIGAQSSFVGGLGITGATTLTAARAINHEVSNFGSSPYTILLPTTGSLEGDIQVFRSTNMIGADVEIQSPFVPSPITVGTLTAVNQQLRFIYRASIQEWQLVPVDSHPANRITSGTLTHERGGLEADVSAYSGLVKISGGSTSAVTVTTAGEALLDDVDAAAQRTTLGLGTAATSNTGDFAAASHSHGNLTSAGAIGSTAGLPVITTTSGAVTTLALGSANQVLKVNSGGTAVEFGAAGGVTSGSVDNAVLRADGTGGSTSQSSDILIDDATTSTQNNVALVNNHSETNSALVLTPKGTGAFIVGPKPDGTSTGGNARGSRAINIALNRTSNTQVASGTDSIAIGNTSSASGTRSIALGVNTVCSATDSSAVGYNCNAGGSESVSIGVSSNASASNTVAIGWLAKATGASAIAIGPDPTASATNAFAVGPSVTVSATRAVGLNAGATLRAQFSSLPFTAVYWGGTTTTNAATVLNLDNTATNRFTIAANTALAVDILLVARRSDTADKWLVARRFLGIRRDGSNNTSLIGSVQTLGTDQSEGSPSWTFALTADDTNDALQLEVTGATSETVVWRATAIYRVA